MPKVEPQEEEEEEEEEEVPPPPTQEKEVSTPPLCIPCYCVSHTVQCGVKATSTSPCEEVPSSILLFYCRLAF